MNKSYITLSIAKTLLLSVLIALSFNSCKDDPNNIGIGIQPDEDFLSITLDTLDFQVTMHKADPITVTDGVVFPQIGSYSDPVFGFTKNTFYSQFDLPGANLDLGNPDTLEIDSVVLVMSTTQRNYGTLLPQEFIISELENDISEDSTYYSNAEIESSSDNLLEPGFETISVSEADMFTYGDSTFATLRFKLKNSIGQSFIDQWGLTPLDSDEDFQEFFKGIALESNSTNGGLISTFPSGVSSGITIYYRDVGEVSDTLEILFPFNNESSFSSTTHDYTNSEFGDFTEDLDANETIYIQGVQGVLAHVEITNIADLETTNLSAINRAELIIPVVENSTTSFTPSFVLYLLAEYDTEESIFVSDMCGGLARGGLYDEELHAYVFNISLHLGDMIKGDVLPEFWITSNIPDNMMVESSCQSQLSQAGILFPSFI